MSIDDGMGGECRVCYTYHLDCENTICTDCLLEALNEATKQNDVKSAIKVIKDKLLKDLSDKWLCEPYDRYYKTLNEY